MQSLFGIAYTSRTYTCVSRDPRTGNAFVASIRHSDRWPTENFGSRYSTSEAASGACLAMARPPSSLWRQSLNSLKAAAIYRTLKFYRLGNTVVTERRAQQWSQTTPEHFRAIRGKVQQLLIASTMHNQPRKGHLRLQALVSEFCPEQNTLSHVMMATFRETSGRER